LVGRRMNTRELRVTLRVDEAANAASIVFDPAARGRHLRTYPVHDEQGDIIATLTFAEGALVELELLDISRQLAAIK
jgi:hypothetical protein